MLKFRKQNGEEVQLPALYDHGRVGQVVIFDGTVIKNHPLEKYLQPYTFTIASKREGKNGFYVLEDADGQYISVQDAVYGPSANFLYGANEWLAFQRQLRQELFGQKEAELKSLKEQLALLKELLSRQYIKVVTEDEAKKLGLIQ